MKKPVIYLDYYVYVSLEMARYFIIFVNRIFVFQGENIIWPL